MSKQAEEAIGLKERVEELKHVASKLERAEAAIEKYKQKLEEAAEAKKLLKVGTAQKKQKNTNMQIMALLTLFRFLLVALTDLTN